jgi:hypothetical protein
MFSSISKLIPNSKNPLHAALRELIEASEGIGYYGEFFDGSTEEEAELLKAQERALKTILRLRSRESKA